MRLALTYLRLALAGLLLFDLQSCSHNPADLPAPAATIQKQELTITEAQTWYQSNYASTFSSSSSNSSSPASATSGSRNSSLSQTHLVWAHALTVGQGAQKLVLVPLVGDQTLFAGRPWQGTRYLVVTKNDNQALDGNLLELLLRRTTTPVDTVALFTSLYHNYHEGHPAALGQGEGYIITYTPDYHYIAGKHFRNGQLLAGNARLKFFPTGSSSHLKGGSPTSPQAPSGSGTFPTGPIANATNGGTCMAYYNSGNGGGAYIDSIGDCGGGNYVYDGNPDTTMPDIGGSYSGPGDYGGTGDSGGSGGSGSGGDNFPSGIINAPATVQQTTPTLGNYSATLAISPHFYQVINVKVELDTNTKDLKKVVVTLNGVVWFSKITQVGDGTLTSYDAATDTYSFRVDFQKDLGGYWSSQETIYGTISPSHGVGTLTIP